MIYDFFISTLSIGAFLGIYFNLNHKNDYHTKALIYFTKILYGMLSFPFLFFVIPQMISLLTKSRSTAYNK